MLVGLGVFGMREVPGMWIYDGTEANSQSKEKLSEGILLLRPTALQSLQCWFLDLSPRGLSVLLSSFSGGWIAI